jgi:hypothetical protein
VVLQTVLLLAAAAAARQTIQMDATAVLAAALINTPAPVLLGRALLGKVLLEAPLLLILQAAGAAALRLWGPILPAGLHRAPAGMDEHR